MDKSFKRLVINMEPYHTPILVTEVLDSLNIKSGKRYIDATVGGGGHALEILRRGGIVLGIDADPEAIEYTKRKWKVESGKLEKKDWIIEQGNFRNIEVIAKRSGFDAVDGILFDLGVSSHQIDEPIRGFSYRFSDAALDMRFDPQQERDATTIVNHASEQELYDILATYGEEQLAVPIVRSLVRARKETPITTSDQLVFVIRSVVRDKKREARALSRVYQALRIAVNDEMQALQEGLVGGYNTLSIGGRMGVISFHSLEDRMVKQYFRSSGWQIINKHPIVPTDDEVHRNIRSRSAKLRVAQKI